MNCGRMSSLLANRGQPNIVFCCTVSTVFLKPVIQHCAVSHYCEKSRCFKKRTRVFSRIFTPLHWFSIKGSTNLYFLFFQARDVITPKRTAGVIVCVITLFVGSGAPVFVVNKLEMKFSPWRNRTLLRIVSSADRENVEKVSMIINNFCLPLAAFMVITACTVLLTYSLHKSTKWRKLSTASSQAGVSDRNKKVAKMVVMISALFISCFLPTTVISVIVAFNLDFTVGGKHLNTGIVLAAFGVILESVNSSSNIFIYYYMSSKYRDTFHSIFYKCRHGGRGPLIPVSCE